MRTRVLAVIWIMRGTQFRKHIMRSFEKYYARDYAHSIFAWFYDYARPVAGIS